MVRIAIDGPGGAGKSSVAKAVAKELGIIYVDTGALYRTIGLFMLRHSVNPKDTKTVISLLGTFELELAFKDGKQIILLDGEDVGDLIRTPDVSMAASFVSAIKEVRDFLLDMQRRIAKRHSVIMDGRDIGTVILPDAEVKIFLTASPEARAQRRHKELVAKGMEITYEQVYNEMMERDKNDSTRDIAPCVPANDAVLLDNSDLNFDETVDKVIDIIEEKKGKKKKTGYMKLHKVLAPLIRFFWRVKVVGKENVPKEGGFIVCANHIAWVDVLLIGASCPRQVKFIAKKELFKVPVLGWIIKGLGAIRLDRGGSDVGAIKSSIKAAESGDCVAIFPQGHRYPGVDPSTTPTKNGAALIAFRSGCDVIPVCLKSKKNKYCIFRRIEVIFGEPIKNEELSFTDGGNEEYKRATDLIFSEILNLGGFPALPEAKSEKGENDK